MTKGREHLLNLTQAGTADKQSISQMSVPTFDMLPRHFKMAMKEDIITTVVQNLTQLTAVPKEWKANIPKNPIPFLKIYHAQSGSNRNALQVLKNLPCFMYHPALRTLIPAAIKIFNENTRYLVVEYDRNTSVGDASDGKKKKKKIEYYDFLKINLFDGVIADSTAYDTLVKRYGCSSDKASPYNVLKLRSHDFERIFVFYRESNSQPLPHNIKEGEKKLDQLMKALKILAKELAAFDDSLFGQMAEVKKVSKPEGNLISFTEVNNKKQSAHK